MLGNATHSRNQCKVQINKDNLGWIVTTFKIQASPIRNEIHAKMDVKRKEKVFIEKSHVNRSWQSFISWQFSWRQQQDWLWQFQISQVPCSQTCSRAGHCTWKLSCQYNMWNVNYLDLKTYVVFIITKYCNCTSVRNTYAKYCNTNYICTCAKGKRREDTWNKILRWRNKAGISLNIAKNLTGFDI